QSPVRVAARARAFDNFLADVAAFRKAHGVEQAGFVDHGLFVELGAVARDAGFDAERFQSFETTGKRTISRRLAARRAPHAHQAFGAHPHSVAFLARARPAHDSDPEARV